MVVLVRDQKKTRTVKEWNAFCKKTVTMSDKGMTYVAIAKKLGVTTANLHTQMKNED